MRCSQKNLPVASLWMSMRCSQNCLLAAHYYSLFIFFFHFHMPLILCLISSLFFSLILLFIGKNIGQNLHLFLFLSHSSCLVVFCYISSFLSYLIYLWLLPCRKDHESCEFDVHEVYAIDILVSTGDGKVSHVWCYSCSCNNVLNYCRTWKDTRVINCRYSLALYVSFLALGWGILCKSNTLMFKSLEPWKGLVCIWGKWLLCIWGKGLVCVWGKGLICVWVSRVCIWGKGRVCVRGKGFLCIYGEGLVSEVKACIWGWVWIRYQSSFFRTLCCRASPSWQHSSHPVVQNMGHKCNMIEASAISFLVRSPRWHAQV